MQNLEMPAAEQGERSSAKSSDSEFLLHLYSTVSIKVCINLALIT